VQVKLCSIIVKFELSVFAGGDILLVGTGKDTFIAAEEAVANFFSQIGRYPAFVFNRQIADTLVGVKLAIGPQGACRQVSILLRLLSSL